MVGKQFYSLIPYLYLQRNIGYLLTLGTVNLFS